MPDVVERFCKAFDADRGTGCHAIVLHRRRLGRMSRRHLSARRRRLCLCGCILCGCHHERFLAVIVSMFLVIRKNAHTAFNSSLNDSVGCTSLAFFMGYNYGTQLAGIWPAISFWAKYRPAVSSRLAQTRWRAGKGTGGRTGSSACNPRLASAWLNAKPGARWRAVHFFRTSARCAGRPNAG